MNMTYKLNNKKLNQQLATLKSLTTIDDSSIATIKQTFTHLMTVCKKQSWYSADIKSRLLQCKNSIASLDDVTKIHAELHKLTTRLKSISIEINPLNKLEIILNKFSQPAQEEQEEVSDEVEAPTSSSSSSLKPLSTDKDLATKKLSEQKHGSYSAISSQLSASTTSKGRASCPVSSQHIPVYSAGSLDEEMPLDEKSSRSKIHGIKELEQAAMVSHRFKVKPSDPKMEYIVENYLENINNKQPTTIVGIGSLNTMNLALKLMKVHKIDRIIIIDRGQFITEFLEKLKNLFAVNVKADFFKKLPAFLAEHHALYCASQDPTVIATATKDMQQAITQLVPKNYSKNACSYHAAQYVFELLTIVRQDWQNEATFHALKDMLAGQNILAYPSNIVCNTKNPLQQNMILTNLQILNPTRTLHTIECCTASHCACGKINRGFLLKTHDPKFVMLLLEAHKSAHDSLKKGLNIYQMVYDTSIVEEDRLHTLLPELYTLSSKASSENKQDGEATTAAVTEEDDLMAVLSPLGMGKSSW